MLKLIRGLIGSGKTTMAEAHVDVFHVEADMFWGPDYKFDPNMLRQAHEWCQAEVTRLLWHGVDVVVSNNLTSMKEVLPYLQIARRLGVQVSIITLTSEFGSKHDVPEHVINRMKARWVPVLDLKGWEDVVTGQVVLP